MRERARGAQLGVRHDWTARGANFARQGRTAGSDAWRQLRESFERGAARVRQMAPRGEVVASQLGRTAAVAGTQGGEALERLRRASRSGLARLREGVGDSWTWSYGSGPAEWSVRLRRTALSSRQAVGKTSRGAWKRGRGVVGGGWGRVRNVQLLGMSWQLPPAFEAGLARWRAAAPAWLEDVLPGRPQLLALGIVAAVGGTIGLVAWAAQPAPATRVAPGTAAKAGEASARSVALEQPTLALPADLRAGSAAAQAKPAAGGTPPMAEPAAAAPIVAVLPAENTAIAEQAASAPAVVEGGTLPQVVAQGPEAPPAAAGLAEAQATTTGGAETQQVVGDLPTADVEPAIALAEAAPEVAVPADEVAATTVPDSGTETQVLPGLPDLAETPPAVDDVAAIGPAATVEEATLPVTPDRVETPPVAVEVAVAEEMPAVTALDGPGPVRNDVAEADSAPMVGQTTPQEQRRDPDVAWAQLQPELESALASDAGRAIVLIDSFLAGAPDHAAARDRRTQALVALTPTPTPPPASPTPTATPQAPTATPTRPPPTPTARPPVVVPAPPPPPAPKPAPAPPPAAPEPAPTATKVPFRP